MKIAVAAVISIAAMYIIVRLSVGAYIIGNRKRHPARHGVSSKQSVIETMEEENT